MSKKKQIPLDGYKLIDIKDLPENCPVLAVIEYPDINMAQFNLMEKVLLPPKEFIEKWRKEQNV